ncbi:N-acetylgalactosamine-N,N'-diacetylbacillosaminyl-diphospho-undecaprenol 4-alpha-N-acetylgalactosaminyltransferase [Pararhizobium capsulatum DSM 1112]|uniref:N-acetylgalactosamine-N, N'-diacetylbacillosaminyl-diphospho-undecaprenol 4-alpha-N-acetylgalactosaminyltransferase n=1 Tax=Pararhizobium capsulatum DSM 1112 TaxID=1121113 RepID=A0ABU0BN43_9HYPH|nr:glycosyltransferase [Pararhizobium capsulatum]MDQ0319679.1 N-acetylgalactosamine-N,N'-diacetylbacillosaminyl-diphospho-undecaprenol 4-alpha-N-acetylgalactosaminyltransferase [Pararhizobium capsulatum DSM 1112]
MSAPDQSAPPDMKHPRRETVVFVINSLTGGGAERVMSTLLQSSRRWANRYDLHLMLLDREPDAYTLPPWITLHRLDSRFSLLRALWFCLPLFRSLRPVVCLSFLTRANLVTTAAARLLGFRAIISERVNPSSHHRRTLGGKLARFATRLVYPLADHVICPSAGVMRDLVENFAAKPAKTSVIANPIDINGITQQAAVPSAVVHPSPYIVTVGRLVENKNIELLLAALKRARTTLDLIIIGEGPLRGELEQQVLFTDLGGRVHFTGFLENPYPLVKAARLFVLPSNAEGFPNALLEAMALGVPVVATNCRSGPSEILDDREAPIIEQPYEGRYGMLVPVGDEKALAGAIDAMTQSTTHAAYSSAAVSGAARFAALPVVERYWEIIETEMRKSVGHQQENSRPITRRESP